MGNKKFHRISNVFVFCTDKQLEIILKISKQTDYKGLKEYLNKKKFKYGLAIPEDNYKAQVKIFNTLWGVKRI